MVARRSALPAGGLLRLRLSRASATATLSPAAARWDAGLGEYVLDSDDARASADPHRAALEFGRSSVRHAGAVCGWDPALAASVQGEPPPIA